MKRRKRAGFAAYLLILVFVLAALIGYLSYTGQLTEIIARFPGQKTEPATEAVTDTATEAVTDTATEPSTKPSATPAGGTLEIHFFELGTYLAGDCIYIKAGDNDILIDGGSTFSSVTTIQDGLSEYVTDGTLEYVIVTHAHKDHYACFAGSSAYPSLFELYDCETVIDFAQATESTKKNDIYLRYEEKLAAAVAAGTTHYTAAECRESGNYTFELGDGMELTILDSYYYYNVSETENDHSVCCLLTAGDDSFLFTGDLEKKGELALVERNDLSDVTLYKAGHHGSNTSSSPALLSVIRPEIIVIPCCAGSPEYTKVEANQFPTQQTINTIATYTDRVYVPSLYVPDKQYTSFNGDITVTWNAGTTSVTCSAWDGVLKDSDWFRNNRICPEAWQ